jgi:hypothetical protein
MRAVLLALALVVSAWAPASAQSAQQMLNYNEMQTEINAVQLIQNNGACSFTGLEVTTVAIFKQCILNNGACAGPNNTLMSWGNMVACRVVYVKETTTGQSCNFQVDADNPGNCGIALPPASVSISSAQFPVTYSLEADNDGSCFVTLAIAGHTIAGVTNSSAAGSYTGGLTGTITATLTDLSDDGGFCEGFVTVSWYH